MAGSQLKGRFFLASLSNCGFRQKWEYGVLWRDEGLGHFFSYFI